MSEIWRILIPSQGVNLETTDAKEVLKFINTEIAFYGRLSINGPNILVGSQNYGSVNLSNRANAELSKISRDVQEGKTDTLTQYIQDANDGLVLVGTSPSGKRVEQLKDTNSNAGVMLACILCEKWFETTQNSAREIVALFRSIAFANPANFGFDNLIEASRAVKDSKDSWQTTKIETEKLTAFVEEKTRLIDDLENLYRKQLTVQEPAISWQNIAAKKTRVWRFWLFLFSILIAAPILAALLYWDPVASAVGKVTGASNGGFSISGLAVISVPALFYAWLLKNISRVFIQNLNLADDADHRRSLALTYMGLLQDDQRPASDQDRAIILNALFRPIPPHTGDEGPPAGVLDLIKK